MFFLQLEIGMQNVLRLSFHKDPITLDPQKSNDKLSSAIIFLLFKGLTRLETDQTIHCDLADSFYSLNNCTKFVFHLGNHCWSDNTPITTQDFLYSWKRALAPSFPLRAVNFFYHIKNAEKAKKGLISLDKVGIHAENERTLVIELEHPCPYFPEITSFCPLFPLPSRTKGCKISSLSSGAFQLQYWEKGREILLRKNLLCKKAAELDAIHIKIIPDEKEAFAAFENDQLDWIGDPISPLPVAYLPALSLKKEIKPLDGMLSCWFNTLKRPFYNVHLRKAIAHAIPRRKLIEKLLLPNVLLKKSLFSSLFQENETFLEQECQEKARKLFQIALHDLRIKQLKITLSYEATDLFSRTAALLKAYCEEIFDISIRLNPLPFKELFQNLRHQQFQVTLIQSISQYTDVINFLERFESRHIPRNFTGWEQAQYQTLLRRYRKTIDQNERQDIAKKAELILLEEMPIAPIYCEHYVYLQKPYVQNLGISPIGVVHFDRVALQKQRSVSTEKDLLTIVG